MTTSRREDYMRRITRRRPTPALLVALCGTGAAAVALVPRNSVGSRQVIDGSLQAEDFGAGQVLAGSDLFTDFVEGPVVPASDSFTTVASLAIPEPGAYVIWSSARVEGDLPGGECHLIAGDATDISRSDPDATAPTVWNVVVQSFSAPGSVDLQCGGISKGPSSVSDIELTATRLASPSGS
jgi:hypothetical protein